MNIMNSLGRVVVMRQLADWLAKHPTLPIGDVTIAADGSLGLEPYARSEDGGYDFSGTIGIHNLYTIAEQVGAEVEITPQRHYGWLLTATWTIGALPAVSQLRITEVAVGVRPAAGPDNEFADTRELAEVPA